MAWRRDDRIADEAARWVVLIDSERFDARAAARFQRWIARSNDHRRIFVLTSRTWGDLDALERLEHHSAISALLREPQGENVAAASGAGAPARSHPIDRRAVLIGAGATLAVGAGAALWWPTRAIAYETQPGEVRNVVLADGTRVTLNGDTRLDMPHGADARAARLNRGEAFFVIAPGDQPPFSIATPWGRIDSAGGEILVKTLDAGARFSLGASGARLWRESLAQDVAASAPIDPGSEVELGERAMAVHPLNQDRLARRALWREGRLAFDDTPLREAAADMTRQTGARFDFEEPALAHLRVGGLIDARDLDGFLTLLRESLGIDARRRADGVIALGPGPSTPR